MPTGKTPKMYNVICLKWGEKYPAEFANRLYRMVKRNTTLPVTFYCLSDNAEGLDPNIEFRQLPDLGLKGWWYKLLVFSPELFDISGTTIFLDLDVVITKNIDELFTYEAGSFRIIKDLQQGYNSSVFRLDIGSMPNVWNDFLSDRDHIVNTLHGDQDWIAQCAKDQMNAWPARWVISYKKQCNARAERSFGRIGAQLRKFGLLASPKGFAELPDTSKIVTFHGKPDPIDVMNGPWDMWKEAPWIREHWK